MTFTVTQRHRNCRYLIGYISLPVSGSHTRTVVRECCKIDDETYGKAKFDPSAPLNSLTIDAKIHSEPEKTWQFIFEYKFG